MSPNYEVVYLVMPEWVVTLIEAILMPKKDNVYLIENTKQKKNGWQSLRGLSNYSTHPVTRA